MYLSALPAFGAELPVLMSAAWGEKACEAWNADAVLTEGLVSSGWIKNDLGRGFKVMQLFRADCGEEPSVEMRVALRDGKAMCVYGGAVETRERSAKADYLMYATTQHWQEMGAGEYGPMKAMMFRRLKFAGPKVEAMGNMTPFQNFLLLAGKVGSETARCP